jgi:hypothetical protein
MFNLALLLRRNPIRGSRRLLAPPSRQRASNWNGLHGAPIIEIL